MPSSGPIANLFMVSITKTDDVDPLNLIVEARSHCNKIVGLRFCIEGYRRIVCITVTLLFWVRLVVILHRAWRGT